MSPGLVRLPSSTPAAPRAAGQPSAATAGEETSGCAGARRVRGTHLDPDCATSHSGGQDTSAPPPPVPLGTQLLRRRRDRCRDLLGIRRHHRRASNRTGPEDASPPLGSACDPPARHASPSTHPQRRPHHRRYHLAARATPDPRTTMRHQVHSVVPRHHRHRRPPRPGHTRRRCGSGRCRRSCGSRQPHHHPTTLAGAPPPPPRRITCNDRNPVGVGKYSPSAVNTIVRHQTHVCQARVCSMMNMISSTGIHWRCRWQHHGHRHQHRRTHQLASPPDQPPAASLAPVATIDDGGCPSRVAVFPDVPPAEIPPIPPGPPIRPPPPSVPPPPPPPPLCRS